QHEHGDVEPDQRLGDVPVLAGESAAERGAGREPGAPAGAHALGALVTDGRVVHAVRADRPVAAAAAQVRLPGGVSVAHRYGRLAHAATLAAVWPYRRPGRPGDSAADRPGGRRTRWPADPVAGRRASGQAQAISTRSITTSCRGRSFASVGTAAIESTTRAD